MVAGDFTLDPTPILCFLDVPQVCGVYVDHAWCSATSCCGTCQESEGHWVRVDVDVTAALHTRAWSRPP